MTQLADYQSRIIAAIQSIPDLAALKVRPCVDPDDAFVLNLSKQSEIFVCHVVSERTGPGVVNTTKQIGRSRWAICTVSTSYSSPTAAQTGIGGIFELVEAIKKIQAISIGVPGGRNEFLQWRSDVKTQAPNRAVLGGGSFGYISEYEAPQRFF